MKRLISIIAICIATGACSHHKAKKPKAPKYIVQVVHPIKPREVQIVKDMVPKEELNGFVPQEQKPREEKSVDPNLPKSRTDGNENKSWW